MDDLTDRQLVLLEKGEKGLKNTNIPHYKNNYKSDKLTEINVFLACLATSFQTTKCLAAPCGKVVKYLTGITYIYTDL